MENNYNLTPKVYEEVLKRKIDKFAILEDFKLEENEKVYTVLEGYMDLLRETIDWQKAHQEVKNETP